MILRHLEIRHFRGIAHARFDDLSERLCLFRGPNESGKSTLVEAIHVGLFERSSGKAEAKQALVSWAGHEGPEVVVGFVDDDGQSWEVHKRFVHQPFTELTDGHRRFKGEDAEKRLRAMFGTKKPSVRGAREADLGIWPVLWVRQGQSGIPVRDAVTDDTRARLAETLAETTGAIAAGPAGRAILERVRAERDLWWGINGKPRKALRDPQEALEAARVARDSVADDWRAAQGVSDELRRTRAELATFDGRVERLEEAVARSRQRAEDARRRRGELDTQVQRVKLAKADLDRATERLARRRELVGQLDVTRHALTRARAAQAEADEALKQRITHRESVRVAVRQAEGAALRAREVLEAARRAQATRQAADDLARARETLATARADRDRVLDIEGRLEAIRVDEGWLDQLEKIHEMRARVGHTLEGAAARITLTTLRDLTLDGAAVEAGHVVDRQITEAFTAVLDGVARLEVHPGGDAVASLLEERDTLDARLKDALARLGVETLADARARRDETRDLEREKKHLTQRVTALAPTGLTALEQRVRELEAAAAATVDEDVPPLDEATRAEQVAADALTDARARLDAVEGPLDEARRRSETTRAEVERHAQTLEHLEGLRDQLPEDAALEAEQATAQSAWGAAVARREELAAAFEDAGGDQADRTLKEDERARDGLRDRRRHLRDRVVQLEERVKVQADDGLYDRMQDAREAFEVAEEAARLAARRAAARARLAEAVEAAWGRLRDQLSAPVREAVADGVRVLFPGSTLELDDEGEVVGLNTHGVVERFEDLSGGAREQLGVLVRLGLAEVLRGERRLPVILDDALVSSDAERRGRMVEVLRRAADTLQILVFTCHEGDFDRLAADWEAEVRGRPLRAS